MNQPTAEPVLIAELIPADYNPRTMSDHDFDGLVKSIQENGFIEPITINADNTIISGHMRTKAAQAAGLTAILAIRIDVTKDEEKALNLQMNRTRGIFDPQRVAELLYGIRGKKNKKGDDLMGSTGFTLKEQSNYLDLMGSFNLSDPLLEELEDVESENYVPFSQPGDLWILGTHRIYCGDSLNLDDLDILMDNAKADMVWTDPPYNVNYEQRVAELRSIKNDNMSDKQFLEFISSAMKSLHYASKAGTVFYICSGWQSFSAIEKGLADAAMHISEALIWVKNRPGIQTIDYSHKHEQIIKAKKGKKPARLIFYGQKPGAPRYSRKEYAMDYDVWEADALANNNYEHPTAKPDWLVMRAIRNSSRIGDTVLDLFAGSSSALSACEKTGRIFRGMELDPRFVDVGVRTWERLSATPAICIRNGEEIVRKRKEL